MRRPLFCALALSLRLLGGDSVADKVAWLADHAAAVRSLDPHARDYSDLKAIRDAIGASRIVLLGGSMDPPVVLAKYRLVRFLHEEMDFDVVASSASFFECEELDRAFDRGSAGGDLQWAMASAFGFRSSPRFFTPIDIFDYARASRKTGQPLHVAGFGTYGTIPERIDYAKQLFQFVDGIDPSLAPVADRKAIRAMLALSTATLVSPRLQQWRKLVPPGVSALMRLDANLDRVSTTFGNPREIVFYRQTMANLASWFGARGGQPVRSRVPDLVVWYAKEWRPASKIIIWADNTWIGRNLPTGQTALDRPAPVRFTPGEAIAREFGAAAYSIAFAEIRNAGEVLEVMVAGPQPALSAVGDNFESLLHSIRRPYSFIDFRSLPPDHWLRQPLTARFINGAEVSAWPRNYDGVITIDLTALKRLRVTNSSQ